MCAARSIDGHEWKGTITAVHWFCILQAAWAGISGFTVQRAIVKKRPRKSSSTLDPVHSLEDGEYRTAGDGLYGWTVWILPQCARWTSVGRKCSACAVAASPAHMDAGPHSRPDEASLSSFNDIWAALFFCCASAPAVLEIFPTPWLHRVVASEADSTPPFPD